MKPWQKVNTRSVCAAVGLLIVLGLGPGTVEAKSSQLHAARLAVANVAFHICAYPVDAPQMCGAPTGAYSGQVARWTVKVWVTPGLPAGYHLTLRGTRVDPPGKTNSKTCPAGKNPCMTKVGKTTSHKHAVWSFRGALASATRTVGHTGTLRVELN